MHTPLGVVLIRTFCLLLFTVMVAMPTTDALAKRNKAKNAVASAEKLPDLNQVLTNAGWTITPEMSAAFSTPGDILDANHGLQAAGKDCFDAKPREGAYTSMEVTRSLTAGVRMSVMVTGVRAGMGIEKKLVFDTPTYQQIAQLDLVPNDACLKKLEGARARGIDMSRWYVITEALSAVIQKQECGSYSASAGGFVVSGDAEVQQMCAQTSLEPVAVAYKVVPVVDVMPKMELRVVDVPQVKAAVKPANDAWAGVLAEADAFMSGRGVPMDRRKAEPLYKKACESGLAEACAELAVILWRGQGNDGENKPRASNLMRSSLPALEEGCKQGNMRACLSLGSALDEGIGAEENDARAAVLYEQSCTGGVTGACLLLGLMYHFGEGVTKDASRAAALFEQSCTGGWIHGCLILGMLYANGEGVTKDLSRASELYEQSCTGGDAYGCYKVGRLYDRGEGVTKDLSRAAELYEQSCTGGYAEGCGTLGMLYANGEGVTEDLSRAAALFEESCTGWDASACFNLGVLYENGEGVTKNQTTAKRYYAKACELGHPKGCKLK
jgi:TPR repeat protein